MNKLVIRIITLTFITLGMYNVLHASIGTSAASILQDDIGARPLGMGSAYTATADDAFGMAYNPACLDSILNPELAIAYKKGIIDTYSSYFGYAKPLGKYGTLGISTLLFDGGNIDINYFDGRTETIKMEKDSVVTLGYGSRFCETLYFGGSMKLLNSTLGEQYNANTICGDIGLLYRSMDNNTSVGFVYQNFGDGLKYIDVVDDLPTSIKAGFSQNVFNFGKNKLFLAADLVKTGQDPINVNTGIECSIMKMIYLRTGYKIGYNPDVLTVGLGITIRQMQIDYAFNTSMNDQIQRMSLTYKFGDTCSGMGLASSYRNKGMTERADAIQGSLPSITTILPNRIVIQEKVIIEGLNLDENPVVTFNSITGDVINVAANRLEVIVPQKVEVGKVRVQVKTDMGITEEQNIYVITLGQYNTEEYDKHYSNGIKLLNSSEMNDWPKAADAFKEAMKYIKTLEAKNKLEAAQAKYTKEEERIKYNDEQYLQHLSKGKEYMSSNDINKWPKALDEFKEALTYKNSEGVKSKIHEAEIKTNYVVHFKKGIKLIDSGGSDNYKDAVNEFKEALKYLVTPEIQSKMKEVQEKYKRSMVR